MRSYLRWGTLAATVVAAGLVVMANRSPQNAATSVSAPGKTVAAASATKTTVLAVSGMT